MDFAQLSFSTCFQYKLKCEKEEVTLSMTTQNLVSLFEQVYFKNLNIKPYGLGISIMEA